MTTWRFSNLADGTKLQFDPGRDVLRFDLSRLSAADVMITEPSASSVNLAVAKKAILLKAPLASLNQGFENITFSDGSVLMIGSDDADQLYSGSLAGNQLLGLAGNDDLGGSGGDDRLLGGPGADTLYGGKGKDRLYGASGPDLLWGDGPDILNGGPGNDVLNGRGSAVLNAGLGDDSLTGGLLQRGGEGNDYLQAFAGGETLDGGAGDDVFVRSDSATRIVGDSDVDTLRLDYGVNLGNSESILVNVSGIEVVAFNGRNLNEDGSPRLPNSWLVPEVDVLVGASGSGSLQVTGQDGDRIYASDLGWMYQGRVEGGRFDAYAQAGFTLLIDTELGGLTFETDVADLEMHFYRLADVPYGDLILSSDIDGDGFNDSILTAHSERTDSGYRHDIEEAYVVFNGHEGSIDLDPPGQIFGTVSASALGDFNGDGYDDVLVLCDEFSSGELPEEEHAFASIVFGGALSTLDYLNVVRFDNVRFAAAVGDVNGDGFEDVTLQLALGGLYILHGSPIQSAVDRIGTAGPDVITGSLAPEVFIGGQGDDTINAGAGKDVAKGADGNDLLTGGLGADRLEGDNGDDLLQGGNGMDRIFGDAGNDTLEGGLLADTLTGGIGFDFFRFHTLDTADRIMDFELGTVGAAATDRIVLDPTVFTALPAGKLNPNRFVSALEDPVAADENDRVLYSQSTGEVFYDPDGSGPAEAALFAVLATHPSELSAVNFIVV